MNMASSLVRPLLAVALLVVLGIALAQVGLFLHFVFTAPAPLVTEQTIIEVSRGHNPNSLARQLYSAGLIRNTTQFVWLGKLGRYWKQIKAGEYRLSPGMTPIEIFATLTSGISISYPVTIREGDNIFEISKNLASKNLKGGDRFLELCRDQQFIESLGLGTPLPPTLEGYLFPDTYHLNRAMSSEDIIRQMARRFLSAWSARYEDRARALGMTRHQVITLASMVEKETGAPHERPTISSVFHNRLRKKMRLQSDPTTIYGMWERYTGNIRKQDLQAKNPYNTYAIPALPIGPIGNPGMESIEAALFPEQSEYLYFVSRNDGTHIFSRTFKEHNDAVIRFQKDPRARQGKSWRDLRKQQAGTIR